MFVDMYGNEITDSEWSRLRRTFRPDGSAVIIHHENVQGKWVSTSWVGLDGGHNFETVVFDDTKQDSAVFFRQYITLQEALLGHDEVVASVKDNTFQPNNLGGP